MPELRPETSRAVATVYSGPAPTREHSSVAVAAQRTCVEMTPSEPHVEIVGGAVVVFPETFLAQTIE
jgi:hypothetical protein